jgi:hypothetical protein
LCRLDVCLVLDRPTRDHLFLLCLFLFCDSIRALP